MQVLIFANGELPESAQALAAWVSGADLRVAADGGTDAALRAGTTPDHVIGDLDSLPETTCIRLADAGARFHLSPADKDETDLELALMWVANLPDVQRAVVLGAFGGRPDQELANLLLLALPTLAGRRIWMVSGSWVVELLRGGETLDLMGQPGDRLSLIPLGGPALRVTTEGLAFPLHAEDLHFGPARGVSNLFATAHARVWLDEGLLWCFHEDRGSVRRESWTGGASRIKEVEE